MEINFNCLQTGPAAAARADETNEAAAAIEMLVIKRFRDGEKKSAKEREKSPN